MDRKIITPDDERRHDEPAQDHELSLALVRDNAHRSLTEARQRITARGADGRDLPLPVPVIEDVSIGQALEAAFLHLEMLKRGSDSEAGNGVDPLDWHEDLLEAVDLAHLSRARR